MLVGNYIASSAFIEPLTIPQLPPSATNVIADNLTSPDSQPSQLSLPSHRDDVTLTPPVEGGPGATRKKAVRKIRRKSSRRSEEEAREEVFMENVDKRQLIT